jgi:hypothetical protein
MLSDQCGMQFATSGVGSSSAAMTAAVAEREESRAAKRGVRARGRRAAAALQVGSK